MARRHSLRRLLTTPTFRTPFSTVSFGPSLARGRTGCSRSAYDLIVSFLTGVTAWTRDD